MSYADCLTEADEFLTYEEGRLQGIIDLWTAFHGTPEEAIFRQVLHDHQTLVDEIRGEEE